MKPLSLAGIALAVLLAAPVSAQQTITGRLMGSPTPSPFGTMTFASQPVGTTSAAQTETATAELVALPAPLPPGTSIQIRSVTASPDFVITGGTCLGGSVLLPDAGSCTIQVAFAPTATGQRDGGLSIRCAVVSSVGVAGMLCNDAVNQFISLAGLGAAGAATVAAAVPALGREGITLLALMLVGGSLYYLRRRG